MLWIKRNLFLSIIGLVALACLGAGTFYLYSSVQKNKALEENLEGQKRELGRLYSIDPFPDRTNIAILKQEISKIKASVDKAKNYFAPIRYEKLTGLEFKAKLDDTIAGLRRRAAQQSVKLPNNFAFSFSEEQKALTLAPAMFPTLPAQLAEVEALCSILFDAKINQLETVRRPQITGTEQGVSDYHGTPVMTNAELKLLTTPYEVTFFTFSPELAKIVDHCYRTNHGFIVKTISLEAMIPDKRTNRVQRATPAQPFRQPTVKAPQQTRPLAGQPTPTAPPSGTPTTSTAPTTAAGTPQRTRVNPPGGAVKLETVIDEKLLKVTLWIYVVRPMT